MSSVFGFFSKESNVALFYTCFVAALFVGFLFRHPRMCGRLRDEFESTRMLFLATRTRLVVAGLFFTVPALLCLPNMLKADDMLWKRMSYSHTSQATGEYFSQKITLKEADSLDSNPVSQIVTINGTEIKQIGLLMHFYETSLDTRLNLKFTDLNRNLIYTSDKDFRNLLAVDDPNADYKLNGTALVKINFAEGLPMIPGTQYRIEFEIDSNALGEQIFLYRDYNEVMWDDSTYLFDYINEYAVIKGDRKPFNLCMQIIGIGN